MPKYYDDMSKNKGKGKGFANMPSEKVMMEYPKSFVGAGELVTDTREALDSQQKDAHKQMMKKPGGH